MDLIRARALLTEGGYTCVLCRGEVFHTATHRGVKPLVDWLDSGLDLAAFPPQTRWWAEQQPFYMCFWASGPSTPW